MYLSTIKNAKTYELFWPTIFKKCDIKISLETEKKIHYKRNLVLNKNIIIHFYQDIHYISQKFHNFLKNNNFH